MIVAEEHKYEQYTKGVLLFRITDSDTELRKNISNMDVQFRMWKPQEYTFKINSPCTVYDGSRGECTYKVKEQDFNEVGTFYSELELSKENYVETTNTFEIIIYGSQGQVSDFSYTGDVWINTRVSGLYQQL